MEITNRVVPSKDEIKMMMDLFNVVKEDGYINKSSLIHSISLTFNRYFTIRLVSNGELLSFEDWKIYRKNTKDYLANFGEIYEYMIDKEYITKDKILPLKGFRWERTIYRINNK
jgi:hypothetical protein